MTGVGEHIVYLWPAYVVYVGPQINNIIQQKSCYYLYHEYTKTNNYEKHH